MDKNKDISGYPNEGSIAKHYLHAANLSIMNENIAIAKINLRFAKDCDAKAEDISAIEARIKMAETETNLKKAGECLLWGDLYRVQQHLTEAKKSGLMIEQISEFEHQLECTEKAKHYYNLAKENVLKRDLENAKQNFELLEEIMDYTIITNAFSGQITWLKNIYQNLIDSERFKNLALDNFNKGLLSDAMEFIRIAKEHGLPFDVSLKIEYQIKGAQYMCEAEVQVTKKQYYLAKSSLSQAEFYKYPKEKVNDIRKKIEDAVNKEKAYTKLESNKHDNGNIIQEIIDMPDRPKRTYFDEFKNMSGSTLNDAICMDETQSIDASLSFVGQENEASLINAMEIDEDPIPQNNSSNDKTIVHQRDSKQQALLKPIENLSISREANNQKQNAQKLSSEAKYESSKNNMKKPPVLEKSQFNDKSASKIDTEHKHKVEKHSTSETATKNYLSNPAVPEKPHSASEMDIDVNYNDAETIKPPENTAINQAHCNQSDSKLEFKHTERKDEKPAKKQKEISLPEKCVILVEKALEEGHVENAEKIRQIAIKLYPEHDFDILRKLIYAAKCSLADTIVTEETKTNEARGKQGNHAEYTMVHEEKDIPKVHNSEHSMTTRGRSQELRKPEHSMTTRGRSQDVRKPEYSLKTREKSVVRPKKDDSNINANNPENKKDDSKTNANYNVNKENKSSDIPNGTANREQADYCLKCAKDAFEAKDFEKAERLATKADRMLPSEESKTILAKVLQMKASSVKQQDNNGQNTNYSAGQIEDKEEAQRSLEIAFTAHAKGDIDKCRRFLRKAQKFDRSIDIDVYVSGLDKKKRDQEAAERAKAQEEQRKAAEQARHQEEQRKAAERKKVQEEQRKAAERKKVQEEQRKAAEKKSLMEQNSSKSFSEKAWVLGKKVINTFIGSGDTEETKTVLYITNKDYSSYKDCLNNNPSSSETKTTLTNNPSPPKAQNKRENDVQGAGALAGASSHTDIETEQGAAKDNASGKTKDKTEKEPENKRCQDIDLKVKDLENKAMACHDVGDYKTALVLLDAALVHHPDKRHVQDLIVQVKDAAKIRNQSSNQPNNQNEAKESVDGNNVNPYTIQNVTHNISRSPKGTDSYVQNKVHYFEKTAYNMQQENAYYSRQYFNSNRGRGYMGGDNRTENTSVHNHHLRSKSKSRYEEANPSSPYASNARYEDAKYLAEMGVKAFRLKQYNEAEKFLVDSDNLHPSVEVRKLINDVRREKNRKGSMS